MSTPSRLAAAGVTVMAVMAAPFLALADTPAQLPARKAPAVVVRIDRSDTRDVRTLSVDERVQRGVVVLERAGQPLGLGTVLMGDGRILTALSPLGAGENIDARFADGSVSRVKLGPQDRAWDLALLTPQTVRWQEGLAASSRDPVRADAMIRGFSLLRSRVTSAPVVLRSYRSFLGGDDSPIENAIELGSRVSPLDVGAPMFDDDGRVAGILGRGCQPNDGRGGCTPVAFGIPVSAIRGFLKNVPPPSALVAAPPPAPPPSSWLGIQGISDASGVAKGVRVLGVHPKSPAADAKILGGGRNDGDIILAVAGQPVTTPEALAEAIRSHAIGSKIPVTLLSKGRYRDVMVTLRPTPESPK